MRSLLALVPWIVLACSSKSSEPAPTPPTLSEGDARAAARAELELLAAPQRSGTSKLYSRGDFLPLDDPKAFDEGDCEGQRRAPEGATVTDAGRAAMRATHGRCGGCYWLSWSHVATPSDRHRHPT